MTPRPLQRLIDAHPFAHAVLLRAMPIRPRVGAEDNDNSFGPVAA